MTSPIPLALALGAMLAVSCRPARALSWQDGPGYRSAALTVEGSKTGFTVMPQDRTGVTFTNVLAQERSLTNQIYLNGSGVALGDIDGDGWCDLYFCGLDNPNILYRNLGNWRFQDITAQAGVGCGDLASAGAALADVDGDGDLDLLVNSIGHGARLFLNNGKGRFHETTKEAGLRGTAGGSSLALADIDGDGWLDLYVANYRTRTLRDEPDTRFKVSVKDGRFTLLAVDGRPVTDPDLAGRFTVDPVAGILENGEPDVLYRNLGHGRFAPLSWTDGTFLDENGRPLTVPYEWALSVMFYDLNNDRAPDIYVCNDFHSEDRIWINDGRGKFRAAASLAFRHSSLFSMGLDVADIDRDGYDDIFVADMLSRSHARRQVQVADRKMLPPPPGALMDRPQYSHNMLFWNRGDDTYAEIAQFSALQASDWCWSPVFLDVDLDGYEDLLMTTGHERDAQNIDLARQIEMAIKKRPMSRVAQMQLRKIFPVYDTPNFAFRNRGDRTFEEVGQAWGFDSTRVSQGIALADLDNDGDMDVVINCLNAAPLLHRNDSPAPRVAVRLRGAAPNTRGIGAKIRVLGGAVPLQSQEMICGGRYVSSDEPLRTFAAGVSATNLQIEVTWRNGRQSIVAGVKPNHIYEIAETHTVPARPVQPIPNKALFHDLSSAIQHRHVEAPYDDFQRQPLLPRRLSQGGPGVTWFDLDGDGWEDLLIGSGRGGQLGAFRNDGKGGFAPMSALWPGAVTRDQTTILGWRSASGKAVLLMGSANYEDGLTNGAVARVLDLSQGTVSDELPGQRSSTGPLALADADGDGDLDMFVGGQVTPGRYPEPASSLYFSSDNGVLRVDAAAGEAFKDLGLVNGAVWSDLDGDGLPELVLACEWGPIRIFRRENGKFREITEAYGLSGHTGWWQSVQAGDFDGDGRLDLVAGNWGQNSRYQWFIEQPLWIYGADLNGDGSFELVEAYFDPDLKKVVPWRDWESLARAMPFIYERYRSFTEFSTAGVSEILEGNPMRKWSARTLDSMVFLNRGNRFEARPLPVEAQWAPVFGLAVADFNGDGHEDLFLSQNFFAVPPEISRCDSGRGLILIGSGRGDFQPMSGQESGILIYGEGRGAAVCDFDRDGRPDVAVGQNAGATRLFRNVEGRPGLRIRLRGPPGNPEGIGAVLWLEDGNGRIGPAREVRAGSGYWSQDAAVQVMSVAGAPRYLRVRWPGGDMTRTIIPAGAREVEVRAGTGP